MVRVALGAQAEAAAVEKGRGTVLVRVIGKVVGRVQIATDTVAMLLLVLRVMEVTALTGVT